MGKFEEFYEKNYKKLIIISYAILLISLILIGIHFARTGEFFNRDISLKGGISVTLYNEKISFDELEGLLKQNFKDYDLREVLRDKFDINFDNKNVYDPGLTNSSFGESFYRGLLIAVLFSFIFMSIVVFISFRTFIPSIAVISAALIDIIAALAVINLLEIKLSAAGIISFLLIIGYSIDTDILLTTRMLKRHDAPLLERLKTSMKTGLTMTFAAIAALTAGYFIAIPEELKQMFLIIIIALVFDIFSTYLGNAGILIHYCKKKNIT